MKKINPVKESGLEPKLFSDVKTLIEQSRNRVACTANFELSILYWRIGARIQAEMLKGERAVYGERVVKTLSERLTREFGSGWSEKHIRHCLHVVETFPDEKIFKGLEQGIELYPDLGI